MEIYVNGKGVKLYKPNQISINFTFEQKENDYDVALDKGTQKVYEYFKLLESLGYEKEQVKTWSFRVTESKIYNESTRKYEKDGFVFKQEASLKFDYDMKKLTKLMEETSKQPNPPTYSIRFDLKDNKQAEEEIIALAYKEAEFQANAVAKASGKEIKECVKISFEPFEHAFMSETTYERAMYSKECASFGSVSERIEQTFVPEDIHVSKTVYCIFTTK